MGFYFISSFEALFPSNKFYVSLWFGFFPQQVSQYAIKKFFLNNSYISVMDKNKSGG